MYTRHLLALVLVFTLPLSGHADETVIEEVLVTATKRETSAQDVPFSLNVQTEEDLRRLGVSNIEEIARNVAGLTIQNLGPGQSQVAIRGVSAGQIVRDQPGVKEQVGIYLDESVISLSLFTPDFDLYDLNRVETLRGPQGTLFGSGSVGGTIRYITNQPNLEKFEASFEIDGHTVTDGDLGGHLKGMVNTPLGDKAALRIVGYTNQYAGFIDAVTNNGTDDDVNDGTNNGIRASVRFEPSDTLTITPRIIYQEIDLDGFNRQEVFNLFANPFTTTRPAIQLDEREQFLLLDEGFDDETLLTDLTIDYQGEFIGITSVTSFMDRDIEVSRDASALTGSVSVDLGFPESAVLLPSNLVDTTKLEQFTQELRLNSNGDGPIQWLVGVFYSDLDRDYSQRLPTPGYDAVTDAVLGTDTAAGVANGFPSDSPFNSDIPYELEQIALFGEVTFDLAERVHLTVGGRFYDFEEERVITNGGLFAAPVISNVVDETESDGFNGRVLLAYEVSENLTFNAQVSEGFRLGGVNDPLNVGLCTDEDEAIFGGFQDYDDETLLNFEAGVKGAFENVNFAVSVFRAEIDDLQATLDAGSCSSRISFNVPEATSTGIEFEISGSPAPGLELGIAGSYLESEFDSTVVDGNGAVLGGIESGNRLASVPEFSMSANAVYTAPGELIAGSNFFVSASVQHIGDRFTQPSDQLPGAGVFTSGLPFAGALGTEATTLDLELDPYTILNVQFGLAADSWEAVLYINNLSDENADLSFDRERGGRARLGFRTNQPRTIGLTYRQFF